MKKLGEMIDLSEQAIGNYERGDRTPNLEIIKKIANALDTAMANLIEDDEKLLARADAEGLTNDVDTYYKSPSDVKLEKEWDSKEESVRNLLSNEYIEKEYEYKYSEFSSEDKWELYNFILNMIKIKVDEIKLRSK